MKTERKENYDAEEQARYYRAVDDGVDYTVDDPDLNDLEKAEDFLFNTDSLDLLKAAVYKDNAENRKLGRVGQPYGNKRGGGGNKSNASSSSGSYGDKKKELMGKKMYQLMDMVPGSRYAKESKEYNRLSDELHEAYSGDKPSVAKKLERDLADASKKLKGLLAERILSEKGVKKSKSESKEEDYKKELRKKKVYQLMSMVPGSINSKEAKEYYRLEDQFNQAERSKERPSVIKKLEEELTSEYKKLKGILIDKIVSTKNKK